MQHCKRERETEKGDIYGTERERPINFLFALDLFSCLILQQKMMMISRDREGREGRKTRAEKGNLCTKTPFHSDPLFNEGMYVYIRWSPESSSAASHTPCHQRLPDTSKSDPPKSRACVGEVT